MTKRKYDHISINGINLKGNITFVEENTTTAYFTGRDDVVCVNGDKHAIMQIKIPLDVIKQESKVCEIIQTKI